MKYKLDKQEKMDRERIEKGLMTALKCALAATVTILVIVLAVVLASGRAQAAGFQCDHDMATGCEIQENNWKAEQSRLAHNSKIKRMEKLSLAVLDYVDENSRFPTVLTSVDAITASPGVSISAVGGTTDKFARCAKTVAYGLADDLVHYAAQSGQISKHMLREYREILLIGSYNMTVRALETDPKHYRIMCR